MTDLPFRVGQAVDVHAFAAPDSQRTLMLACLEWPGERALEGHSDADVAAHALCDGPQSLKPEQFDALAKKLLRLKEFVKTIEE